MSGSSTSQGGPVQHHEHHGEPAREDISREDSVSLSPVKPPPSESLPGRPVAITVFNSGTGQQVSGTAYLDTGCGANFISAGVAKRLGLLALHTSMTERMKPPVDTYAGVAIDVASELVNVLWIASRVPRVMSTLCFVVDTERFDLVFGRDAIAATGLSDMDTIDRPLDRRKTLDPEFSTVDPSKRRVVFRRGVVVRVLWFRPASAWAEGDSARDLYNIHGWVENVHAQPSWLVIVQRFTRHCIAVPVITYDDSMTTQADPNIDDYAALILQDAQEVPLPDRNLKREPFHLILESGSVSMKARARINFAKAHTIEYSFKLQKVGRIVNAEVERLLDHFLASQSKDQLSQDPRNTTSTPDKPKSSLQQGVDTGGKAPYGPKSNHVVVEPTHASRDRNVLTKRNPAQPKSMTQITYNPTAFFPRQSHETERGAQLSRRPAATAGNRPVERPSPSREATQPAPQTTKVSEVREEFILKTPSKDFADWCRFIDRHPELLDDQNEAVLYTNAAIRAMMNGTEDRAKLCLEKAAFLAVVGGKTQRDRDHFFEKFHERDKTVVEAFRERFDAFEILCRDKVGSKAQAAPRHQPAKTRSGKSLDESLFPASPRRNAADISLRSSRYQPEDADTSRHQAADDTRVSLSSGHQRGRSDIPINLADPGQNAREPSIKGGPAEFEKLDVRYQRRAPKKAGAFFRVGSVFAILEHREDGRADDSVSDGKWRTKKADIVILSHIRRFAVVREGHGYCWALPINTYNGRGLIKSGFSAADAQAHAIIYDSQSKPATLQGEPRLNKTPIAVDRSEDAEPLAPSSRINFAKVMTVEHNVRAMAVGMVAEGSMANFKSYWKEHLLK